MKKQSSPSPSEINLQKAPLDNRSSEFFSNSIFEPSSNKTFKATTAEKELPGSKSGAGNSRLTRKKSRLFDDTVDADKDIQDNSSVTEEVDTDKLETATEQVVSDSNSFEDLATESSGSEFSTVGGQRSDFFGESLQLAQATIDPGPASSLPSASANTGAVVSAASSSVGLGGLVAFAGLAIVQGQQTKSNPKPQTPNTPSTTPLSLVVQDGYLDGAEVWVDMNDNGVVDASVDVKFGTSVNGRVNGSLTDAQKSHALIATGGNDISTGLPFQGSYSATAGSTVVNPLTSLVQSMVQSSMGSTTGMTEAQKLARINEVKANALTAVNSALGLPADADLTRIDTVSTATASTDDAASGISLEEALNINSKALMVANLMAMGAAALQGAATGGGAAPPSMSTFSNFIVEGIVDAINTATTSGETVALGDNASLTAILNSAGTAASEAAAASGGSFAMDSTKLAAANSAVATSVASTNSLISTLTGNAIAANAITPGSATGILTQMLAAQKAVLSQLDELQKNDVSVLNTFTDVAAVFLESQKTENTAGLKLGTQAVTAPTVVADTLAATVSKVTVQPTKVGDLAKFEVEMSEGLFVKFSGANRPTIAIQNSANGIATAVFDPGSSTGNKLVFTYRVQTSDTQLNIAAGTQINLPSGSVIKDLGGNSANLSLDSGLTAFKAAEVIGTSGGGTSGGGTSGGGGSGDGGDPVSIVFAQKVTMDGATKGGDANLQTTAIKYTLTTSVPIQGLDINDFLVSNGEVTSVYQPASFEFSEDQELEEVLGNGLMIVRDVTTMYGALNLVTPSGQASQAYDQIEAVGELADGTVVLILKTYGQMDRSTVAELKFYDSTGEEIPDYLNIDFTNLSNAEIINSSAIIFKFSESDDLLVDSKGNSLPLPQSSSYDYWTLPDGDTLIYHSSFSEARFASDELQTTDEEPGMGVVFLDVNGELTTTHPYGDHDFEGAVIKDVIRGAILYSKYDVTTKSVGIYIVDPSGAEIINSNAGWDYSYYLHGDDNSLIHIYRDWNYELGDPLANDTYSSIVFVDTDGRLVEAGGIGSPAYYGGHAFEGANIERLYDNGVITYYLYDELEDVYSGYIIPKDGDPIFIKDFDSFRYGSTKEYSNGSIIFDLSDGTTILANADGEITKLSEYVDDSYSLLDAEGGKLEILGATEFSSLTHKSSSNGLNYWEVEITGYDNVVTKAIAVTNDLGILAGADVFQAGTYYTPGLQIGSFELQENQYIYSWLENGTFIVGDYALYDPSLNPDIFLNNGGERVNTFVLIDSAGNVLSKYFTNDTITTAEDNDDNDPDSYSYISGIPEGGMVLRLQVNEPDDKIGRQIIVLDNESKVSLDVYISPNERIYYLKSILPEGLIYSAFNDQDDIIYKLANSEGETLAAFDNYLVSADGHLFLDMNDEVQTWDWETKTATPLTFTPDPLKWMVEVKPNDGVEGSIALSLKADATIVDEDSALLKVSEAPPAPLVPVDTLGPISPTVLLGPDVDGDVTREEAAHENGVVTITAEMGSSVEVTFSKDGSEVLIKTVTGAGSTPVAVLLSADEAITLGYGSVVVNAVATDAAGNAGDPGNTTFSMQLPNYAPVFETTGLVAYWKMDKGTGTVAQDSGPNGLDANLMSGAAWANTGAPGLDPDASVSLNNDYLQVTDSELFNLSGGFTISAWAKPSADVDNVIMDRGENNLNVSIRPNGVPGLGFYIKEDFSWLTSETPIETNEWVHVAVSWDPDTRAIKFYKNGALTDTFSNIQSLDFGEGELNIGRQNPFYSNQSNWPEQEMNGQLDEVAIFNRALPASEISSMMQSGLQTGAVVFPENSVGIAYQANATDVNQDTVIYGLDGTDAALFKIDASTGAVTFKTTPDYETPGDDDGDNVYNFTITARDAESTPTALAVSLEVLETASAVSINSRTNSSITVDGETDLYSIQLTEGKKYIFTLEAGSFSELDAGLNLFGPSTSSNIISLLKNDNAFYLNNNARITYVAQETGTYYIQANGVSGTSGDYVLSVSDINAPTPSRIAIPNPPTDAGSPNPDIQWKFIPNRGTGAEFYLIVDAPSSGLDDSGRPYWNTEDLPYWTDLANRSLLVDIESGEVLKHNGDQDGIRSGTIFVWDGPTVQSHVMQDLSRDTDYIYVVPRGAITGVNGLTNDYYESTIYPTTDDAIGPVAISGGVATGTHGASYNNLTGFSSLDVAAPGQTLSIPTSPDYLFVQFNEPVRWPAGGWNEYWSAAASNGVIDGVYLKEEGVPVYEFGVAYIPDWSDYQVGNIHLDLENKTGSDTSYNDETVWLSLRHGFEHGGVPVGYTLKEDTTYTLVFDVGMYDPMFNISEPTTPPFEFSFIVSQVL